MQIGFLPITEENVGKIKGWSAAGSQGGEKIMIYEPREITCRDGRSCILRCAAVTDANDLIRYLKVTAGETPFLIREPDEISLTPEQEEHFIEGIVKEPRELMLI